MLNFSYTNSFHDIGDDSKIPDNPILRWHSAAMLHPVLSIRVKQVVYYNGIFNRAALDRYAIWLPAFKSDQDTVSQADEAVS